jgi:hypothetical protein
MIELLEKNRTDFINASNQNGDDQAINLINELYDLYDAQRWIKRFVKKYAHKDMTSTMTKLQEALSYIDEETQRRITEMDSIISSKKRPAKYVNMSVDLGM